MGLKNTIKETALEYVASTNTSGPLAQQVESQLYQPPDENEHAVQREMRQVKNQYLKGKRDEVKGSFSGKKKTLRAVDLAIQKGACSWLTVLPIRDMNSDLKESEFRDAVKIRYDSGKFLILTLSVYAGTFSMWITLRYGNRADLSSNAIFN